MIQFLDNYSSPFSSSHGTNSHDVTGVKEVHESMKLFGKGIKIGIIDSGVDYTVCYRLFFKNRSVLFLNSRQAHIHLPLLSS